MMNNWINNLFDSVYTTDTKDTKDQQTVFKSEKHNFTNYKEADRKLGIEYNGICPKKIFRKDNMLIVKYNINEKEFRDIHKDLMDNGNKLSLYIEDVLSSKREILTIYTKFLSKYYVLPQGYNARIYTRNLNDYFRIIKIFINRTKTLLKLSLTEYETHEKKKHDDDCNYPCLSDETKRCIHGCMNTAFGYIESYSRDVKLLEDRYNYCIESMKFIPYEKWHIPENENVT